MISEKTMLADKVKKIDSESFLEILKKQNEYQIVDVNEIELDFNFNNKIFHIPFSKLEDQQNVLDKNKPTILICKYGEKSFFAASVLQLGYEFSNVYSLSGGMEMLKEYID